MEFIKTPLDVGLVTGDAARACAFYAGILGLRELKSRSLGGGTVQHRFLAGDQVIKILDYRKKPRRSPSGLTEANGYRLLALAVDDLDGIAERMSAAGQKPEAPRQQPDGTTILDARDADDNPLELVHVPEPGRGAWGDRLRIGLTVSDSERARHFYGQVLGLPEQAARPREGLLCHAFRAGSSTLELWSMDGELPSRTGPPQDGVGIRYVTFAVRGIPGLCERLEARGATIAMPPRELGGVVRIMFVEDPDGNWLEFGEPLAG